MFSYKPYLRVFLNAAFILVMMVALIPITSTIAIAATAKDDSKASPGMEWTLEAELTLPASEVATRGAGGARAAMIDPLVSRLQSAGVQVEAQMLAELEAGVPYVLKASGKGTLDDFRNILYTVMLPEFNLLGGVTEIEINADALLSSSVDLAIETNPSTGYAWLVADDSRMKESAPASYKRKGTGVGMSEKQTLHLQVSSETARAVKLVYKRPWESAPATRRLTLKLSSLPASFDLSDPTPVPVESDLFQGTAAADETATAEPATPVMSLPSSFDWRTAGKVTDIRNQGNCGSCWAFATVGVMESALLQASNTSTNLSEQFLVSCNNDGWSCDGGLVAHKYHYNTLGRLQSTVGAVLESDFPYTATNDTCKAVSNHPYKLSSWTTVSTAPNIATTDQIKQAIYDHGVVTSRVCVGNSFDYYTGGIFTTDEKSECYKYNNYYGNHMIDLVGWDDAGQYFILRNSWDTSWGENGYMRIHYGISLIGQDITWATAVPDIGVYSMSGTVHAGSADGRVISDAQVSIADKSATTDTSGAFSITGIAAGTYTLIISATDPGYSNYTDNSYAVNSNQSGLNLYLTLAGSVIINNDSPYTKSRTVTLALSSPAAKSMRLGNDGTIWGKWKPYATKKAYTLPSGDGVKTVYAQFRDAGGSISPAFSDSITLDMTKPVGSININNNATSTTDPSVILTLDATDAGSNVVSMRFSSNNITWSSWETFNATKTNWTLLSPTKKGKKKVYARFQDGAGNISPVYSDFITLTLP